MKKLLLAPMVLALMLVARAALPPLSPQELENQATDIVLVTVMNVTESVEDVSGGNDHVYKLNVRVDDAKKGTLRSGLTLTVECRKTGERPQGWAGPQGQNEIPAEKARVKMYLREQDNRFFLLEPNGWAPL